MDKTDHIWARLSKKDWVAHLVQTIQFTEFIVRDYDHAYFEAIKSLDQHYRDICSKRVENLADPESENELDNLFYELQRGSSVADILIGCSCVTLARWISTAVRYTTADLLLISNGGPIIEETSEIRKKKEVVRESLIKNYGAKVEGSEMRVVSAIRAIANIFKHGTEESLHKTNARIAATLGFSSQLLDIPESENEPMFRQQALDFAGFTLDGDSIERMAIQIGCGTTNGLMPLYGHVETWLKEIQMHCSEEFSRAFG